MILSSKLNTIENNQKLVKALTKKNLTDLEISVVKSQIFNQSHELQKTKPKKFTQAWNCAIAKLLDYPKQPFSIDQEKVADACFKLIQG